VSYLCINFWSNKVNYGIKAVIYNKIGDNLFIYIMVFIYYELLINSYYSELVIILVVLVPT